MKRTLTEAHVYMRHHQDAKVKRFDVSNMIYHKFSHGAFSYMLNGEKVNVMSELAINLFSARIFFNSNTQETAKKQVYPSDISAITRGNPTNTHDCNRGFHKYFINFSSKETMLHVKCHGNETDITKQIKMISEWC